MIKKYIDNNIKKRLKEFKFEALCEAIEEDLIKHDKENIKIEELLKNSELISGYSIRMRNINQLYQMFISSNKQKKDFKAFCKKHGYTLFNESDGKKI